MRRLAVIATLLGTLAMPAAASARTRLPDCAGALRVKPRTVIVFCADAGLRIRRLHWTAWRASTANGWSRYAYANDCRPDCASGHFHRYRVDVVLRRPVACGPATVFTRMRIAFVGRKWAGPRRFTQPLACPTGGG